MDYLFNFSSFANLALRSFWFNIFADVWCGRVWFLVLLDWLGGRFYLNGFPRHPLDVIFVSSLLADMRSGSLPFVDVSCPFA